jgi:outer membrane cobalamin receptor
MHSRVFLKSLFSLFLTFFILHSAHAGEILVTATPLEDESPAAITQKAPTAFTQTVKVNPLAYGLTNTLNALRLSGSVDLPEYGQSYMPPTATLRGSKDQQTLIMLDGVPLSSFLGDSIDLSLYPITDIDRMEIIKGSNSAAYGPSAMGGVVNIVTRNPDPKNSVELTSSQGSYGYNLYNLMVNRGGRSLGFMAGITRSWGDNDYLYDRTDGSTVRRVNNDFDNTSFLTKVWGDLGGWDTTLTGNLLTQDLGSPGGEGYGGADLTPNDRVNASQYFLALTTIREIYPNQGVRLSISRIGNRTHVSNDNMWVTGDSWSKLTSDYLDLVYTARTGMWTLSPELTVRSEGLSSDEYGNHARTVTSGLLNAGMGLDPVLLSGTLRYDHSTDFDGHWTWHGGLLWSLVPHVSLKANAGTGYHEPTMGNLYTPSTFTTFVTNPDLKPEKSISYDAGPVIEFQKAGFGAAYFVTDYDDMIKMTLDMDTNTSTCVNVDKARVSGVDAYAWARPVDSLKLTLGYLYSRFVNESDPYESKILVLKPEQIFTAQADYLPVVEGRPLDLFLSYQFREGVYTDDGNTDKTGNRNILDAGASAELVPHAVVAFKVSNLLDDRSVEYKSGDFWYPVPGRTYHGSIRLSF